MTNPFVSIIIPNYNHSKYLDERIQSVLNQNYEHYEVIILDDKSSDNSLEVISRYTDNPHVIQVVVNDENSGSPFKQWQKGLNLAKGDYIWIAESDDSCVPSFLDKIVNVIVNNKDVSLAFCRSWIMDEKGVKNRVFQKSFGNSLFYKGEDFIRQRLVWGNCVVNASAALFSKDCASRISSEYMNFRGVGDWLFWTELSERGNVAIVDEPLNYYRYYSANTTSGNRTNGNEVKEAKCVFDYFTVHNHLSWLSSIRIRKKYIWHIKYKNDFPEHLRKELLGVWGDNLFLSFLAYLSKKKR